MITVTVEHILSIKPILQEAAHMPMSARDSYRLMRVLKVLDKEYETIETTQRNLIERCAERDENGNYVDKVFDGTFVKASFVSSLGNIILSFPI